MKDTSGAVLAELPSAREQGQLGETLALRYLYRQGYDILERNFRCRAGELDLIAYDGPVLAFIEVKARSSHEFGTPGDALVPEQQERIRRAAATYRRSRRLEHLSFRFDLVAVDLPAAGKPSVKLIRNVF
jgi:putative endonuclease